MIDKVHQECITVGIIVNRKAASASECPNANATQIKVADCGLREISHLIRASAGRAAREPSQTPLGLKGKSRQAEAHGTSVIFCYII